MFVAAGAAVNYSITQKIAAVRKTLAQSISAGLIHRAHAEVRAVERAALSALLLQA